MTDAEKIIAVAEKKVPGVRIVEKRTSKFMRFLNVFVGIFNASFLSDYVTTIHKTIYWPDMPERWANHHARTLAHEFTHAYDDKIWPLHSFKILYLSPQIWSVVALLGLTSIWFGAGLWFLLFLVLLLPWPAVFRAHFEIRAFTMTFLFDHYLYSKDANKWIEDRAKKIFGSGAYYWMMPAFIARWWMKKKYLPLANKKNAPPSLPKNLPFGDTVIAILLDHGCFVVVEDTKPSSSRLQT